VLGGRTFSFEAQREVTELRDYQTEALDGLRAKLGRGVRRIALVAPTGAGKTTIAGAMIKGAQAKGRRCIFLAHRKELIEQCSARLDEFSIAHGIIQQKHKRTDPRQSVQVASVQTLIRKDHWAADLIIVDECHRSTSKTYTDIIARYDNPAVIGLTATPYRMDGRGLGEIYDDLHELISTQALIDLKYLVMPVVFGSRAELDLSKVKVTAGDYNKQQLADAMKETILRGDLVQNWAERVGERTGAKYASQCRAVTVVFAPSVEQSLRIVAQFNDRGVPAEHIDAKTPAKERAETLRKLRAREISVVSNVGILTEGWDLPHLECVVLARPTRSRSLYKQMIGRLMRPDAEKRFAFVLDHANCTQTHGFVNETEDFSLKGREKRPRKGSSMAPHKKCKKCDALLALSVKVCSHCGHQIFEVDVRFTDEKLVELRPGQFKRHQEKPVDERQKTFDEFCKQCITREYNPNWARMRYQSIYGHWPAWKTGIRVPKFFRDYEAECNKKESEDQLGLLSPSSR
jgi:superfamily II DNA or RNA helicase